MILTHSSSPGVTTCSGELDVVRRHLRDVHETLDALAHLDERTERHELGDPAVDELADLVAAGELLPRILLGGLQRQADALAVEVDVEHLHGDLVADGHDLAGMLDVLPRQLADVDQPVHATEVDERTELHDARHHALADLARLEVGEELVARFLLGLLQVGAAADSTTLLRFLSSSMILACSDLADVRLRSRTRRSSTSDAGRKPRRPMSMIRPPLTTSITGPSTTPSSSLIFSIVPHARSYCARFLDSSRRPSLSSFWRTSASTLSPSETISCGSTSLRMRQLTSRDDAFALVADVEQDLVLVDLDDGAVDELAVLDVDHRAVDGIGEGHAEIVGDDLAGGVVAFLVEGAHRASEGSGRWCRTREDLLSKEDGQEARAGYRTAEVDGMTTSRPGQIRGRASDQELRRLGGRAGLPVGARLDRCRSRRREPRRGRISRRSSRGV